MMESRFDTGMKVRKEVLGSEYVERAQAHTTALAKKEFDQPARAAAEADSAQAGQEEDA